MSDTNSSTTRIAKNTLILYGRMLLLMLISLYTSRIVLSALGVTDYGISNVVGGLISMFTMVSDTFSTTISRFITYHIGKGDLEKLRTIFATSVNIQIILSIIIVILMETIGLWFLEMKLVIPEERMIAARWVFQLSIFTFVLNLISVPYNSEIISHERMDVFAYFSLFEALAKLTIAFLIMYTSWDKLVYYSFLSVIVALIQRIVYGIYCTKKFPECKYKVIFDKPTLLEMSKFSGWNFLSSGALVLRVQGTNILINIFFGPIMNAAKGIANQLNTMLHGFVANFSMALSPQITKNYAANNREYMKKIAFQGAKFSYLIFLIISIPILCDTHFVLKFWLGQVPEHSVLFARLIVLYTLLDSLSKTTTTSIYATGHITKFQIYVSIIELLNLPASYIFLKYGAIPEIVTIVSIILSQICLLVKLNLAHEQLGFSIKEFIAKIYLRVILVSVIAIFIPIMVIFTLPESIYRFFVIGILSIITTSMAVYYIGCDNSERSFLLSKTKKIKSKFLKQQTI